VTTEHEVARSGRSARAAAVLTWVYAAGFGVPAVPVAIYLNQRGRLPEFMGLFPMYGGPWSSRLSDDTFVLLLIAFLLVALIIAWSAWLVWKGSRAGLVLNFVMLPVEAVFWIGFALPIPWVVGVARAGLVASSWKWPAGR
jgi:hypothetical protein